MSSLLKGGLPLARQGPLGSPPADLGSAVALEGVLPGGVPAQSGVYKRSVHSGRPSLFNLGQLAAGE